jgi:hypothetical protein
VRGLASSPLDAGCAEACAGHSNNDFESPGLPSYQHFRPSMRRYDHHCPCGFDGIAALHCCFASAVDSPSDESAMQVATVIAEICFVIWALRDYSIAAIGLPGLIGQTAGRLPEINRVRKIKSLLRTSAQFLFQYGAGTPRDRDQRWRVRDTLRRLLRAERRLRRTIAVASAVLPENAAMKSQRIG